MNLQGRHDAIVALCRAQGSVTVEGLAERFRVTPQTIRRDINVLSDANLLRRRHGGAELVPASTNVPYDTRRVNHLQAKMRIGLAVAARIPAGASLLLGIGTTPEQVAVALARHEGLMVVTNNLRVALTFAANPTVGVVMAGGSLRKPNPEVLGEAADALFRRYRADFGIYGVGGIDTDGTLLDFDHAEAASRQALRESCRVPILVADASKFGRHAPVRGGHLSEAAVLVTDADPGLGWTEHLAPSTDLVLTGAASC
ncbi:DeoR/GlpR transcriptional regulator [Achromobacter sp. GG226]|uniref:DeoR/GlpR family DNA-binding transcription regulator n=1 Tax=Verticiella alkaliphila TaxID=2779529 RepID=UPI001C0B1653|nr:DeoR/GlpR family DNA-binding transcription regulator [Verticiella sp. GG226]MBU4611932.1 DeoR/GlpR transcriptional regulator [Verticiella sp. GG226]